MYRALPFLLLLFGVGCGRTDVPTAKYFGGHTTEHWLKAIQSPDAKARKKAADMLGNVGEFCGDWYQGDYYQQSPAADPTGPREKAKGHVVRGGTFLNGPWLVRATSRVECPDVYRNYVIGFRVLLETGGK